VRYGKTRGLAEERRRNGVIGVEPLFHLNQDTFPFMKPVDIYNVSGLGSILKKFRDETNKDIPKDEGRSLSIFVFMINHL
jgi:hypothetical protein